MPISAFNRLSRTRLAAVGSAVAAGAVALTCAVGTGTAEAATPTPTTYTVKAGDTLASIARHEHVPGGWKTLAGANHIASPYLIKPGEVLKLSATAKTTAAKPGTINATTVADTTSAVSYPNNLDGWIRNALAIMQQNGIPGSYDGIYRNIMRESSGNPNAVNNWDSNAAAGTPSEGLLQVIQPTFNAYHVPGTSWNLTDPVANITAACNYAYHVYGSIDNVNGPY
ncbi:LysM peptidoglycan-binding domain-containing protein [Streptomyces sp. ICBB 8177]|uniref:transglycosylase SLT domain-containing protein n=1 Tax=Streptomyces sp. ICBB 8177 TaxID=563922 RepID=UPI000D671FC6|nr:LysM peptidoglycan-binding domain-containing protein [Streptomyces sp. ICBB 8177]PWI44936.1 peptidoglycan-binding protein [Streptomyces sp. ICBB 8177]